MRRAQRRFHANVWPMIALAMLAILAAAVVVREHPAPNPNAAVEEPR